MLLNYCVLGLKINKHKQATVPQGLVLKANKGSNIISEIWNQYRFKYLDEQVEKSNALHPKQYFTSQNYIIYRHIWQL